jgi:hypothetical protein
VPSAFFGVAIFLQAVERFERLVPIAKPTDIGERRRRIQLWRELVRISQSPRDAVIAQPMRVLVLIPRAMAELHGELPIARQEGQEIAQRVRAFESAPLRRELKENRAETIFQAANGRVGTH